MENLQVGFVVLLLTFVVYVSFFDVKRVGFDIGVINNDSDQPTASQPEPESTQNADTAPAEPAKPE
jgi:hypothetical protein